MSLTTPPLNSLRVFDAVSRHLNLTHAAEALHITQSAVSQQLKLLEQYLDTVLIDRNGHQLSLTKLGEIYATEINRAFDNIRRVTHRIKKACLQNKRIAINVPTSFAYRWLFPRLPSFQQKYPEYEIVFSTPFKVIDFSLDDLDAAVYVGCGNWGDDVISIKLIEDDILPICSPQLYEDVKQRHGDIKLSYFTLLESQGITKKISWGAWLKSIGEEITEDLHFLHLNQYDQSVEAALQGLGIALSHSKLVENDIAKGNLMVPFDVKIPSVESYYYVFPKESAEFEKIKILRDWLLDEAKIAKTS